jgi:hypothetical protein
LTSEFDGDEIVFSVRSEELEGDPVEMAENQFSEKKSFLKVERRVGVRRTR